MATSFFITTTRAQLYNSKALPRDMWVPQDTKLECDWLWDSGVLIGKRKVVNPLEYANLFINDSDVTAYAAPEPPPPPPDTADSYRVDLGVYIQPDAASTRIGELAQGETVISIELRDGWLMIERGDGGQTGWVRTTHLAPVGDAPTLPFAPHLVKHIWLDAAGNPTAEETYIKE